MTNDNPYQPPHDPSAAPDADFDKLLGDKARLLLQRRNNPHGIGYYWRALWSRRYLLFTVAHALVIGGFWVLGHYAAAAAFAGILAGRTLRDFRWIAAIFHEWRTTKEFIDWEKVERLAGDTESEKTISN